MYSFFHDLMPFKNATENAYWRVKALGASIGVAMVALFFVVEIGIVGTFIHKLGLFSFGSADQRIALIEINEQITVEMANNLIEKLEELKDDSSVKSVLIKINSGGGSPAASDDIANYLKGFQKEKTTRVYVQEIAASGAYYIASAIHPLNANPNAIVGSIGVVLPHYNVSKAAKKLGIEEDHIVAGKWKIPLSAIKQTDRESKEYLQNNLLQPAYSNFKKFVAINRGLTDEALEKVVDGKIFIASMPEIQNVLVDRVVSYRQIIDEVKKECSGDCPVEQIDYAHKESSLLDFKMSFNGGGIDVTASPTLSF